MKTLQEKTDDLITKKIIKHMPYIQCERSTFEGWFKYDEKQQAPLAHEQYNELFSLINVSRFVEAIMSINRIEAQIKEEIKSNL